MNAIATALVLCTVIASITAGNPIEVWGGGIIATEAGKSDPIKMAFAKGNVAGFYSGGTLHMIDAAKCQNPTDKSGYAQRNSEDEIANIIENCDPYSESGYLKVTFKHNANASLIFTATNPSSTPDDVSLITTYKIEPSVHSAAYFIPNCSFPVVKAGEIALEYSFPFSRNEFGKDEVEIKFAYKPLVSKAEPPAHIYENGVLICTLSEGDEENYGCGGTWEVKDGIRIFTRKYRKGDAPQSNYLFAYNNRWVLVSVFWMQSGESPDVTTCKKYGSTTTLPELQRTNRMRVLEVVSVSIVNYFVVIRLSYLRRRFGYRQLI